MVGFLEVEFFYIPIYGEASFWRDLRILNASTPCVVDEVEVFTRPFRFGAVRGLPPVNADAVL